MACKIHNFFFCKNAKIRQFALIRKAQLCLRIFNYISHTAENVFSLYGNILKRCNTAQNKHSINIRFYTCNYILSPINAMSLLWHSIVLRPWRSISGFGLPTKYVFFPVAISIGATSDSVAGIISPMSLSPCRDLIQSALLPCLREQYPFQSFQRNTFSSLR